MKKSKYRSACLVVMSEERQAVLKETYAGSIIIDTINPAAGRPGMELLFAREKIYCLSSNFYCN